MRNIDSFGSLLAPAAPLNSSADPHENIAITVLIGMIVLLRQRFLIC